jgi:ribulose-5-phosphate 4-epimerase/fuculose-1-phosphate aldolase
MTSVFADTPELRSDVAAACRILAGRGLVDGILGHVSARVSEDEMVLRCRTPQERGLALSTADDVWRVTFDGVPVDLPDQTKSPIELPIHAELMRSRPEIGCVIHAHPPEVLLAGLAGLRPRPVFGAFNVPALRLALEGIPVFPRSALISTRALAGDLLAAMGDSRACLMVGHGVTVAAADVREATVLAVSLGELFSVTLELARLGAEPPEVGPDDIAQLADSRLIPNFDFSWQAYVAALPPLPGSPIGAGG